MKPKISVLTTVYNGERFLEETIKNILNQSFKDFEYIIVDDGPTDKTKEIIKSFEKKDARIKYIYYGKNKGYENLNHVVNLGLQNCKGKYIARLDAGDLCHKDRLKIQYNYLEKHPRIFLIGSSADVIDKNGKKVDQLIKKPWPPIIIKFTIGFNNPFIHSSVFFRNEGQMYPSHIEHFFFINLVIAGKKLKNLGKKLVKYRINPGGLISKTENIEDNRYKEYYKDEKSA